LDSVRYTIIGVLPPSFQLPARDLDAWVPLQPSAEERSSGAFWLETVGRLKSGASLAQAQQQMTAIAARLGAEPPGDRELGVALVSLRDEIARPFRAALIMLTAAVVGVLLIACVNVAGMLTARGAARRREVAIRIALGASRRRVGRQLLTEAVMLFVFGGVLGVTLGWVLLRLVVTVAPPTLSWLRDVSLDGTMLAVALGMAALTGVLVGVLPSWKAAGSDVVEVVASGVKGAGRGDLSQGFRRALIVSQIAIATIVASAASLSLTSLVHAQRVDLGFEPGHVLTARVELPRTKYAEAAARQQFFDRLLERERAVPGVTGAAAGSMVVGRSSSSSFSIEGRRETIQQPLTFDSITPAFFQVLQVPLLRGRFFSDFDRADTQPVAIVNETTAKTHWPNEDPLGKRFKFGEPDDDTWLLGAFVAAAIALTAIGLYGLLAYVVALRRHEMAVRVAIGGSPRHVLRLIVRHVAWVVGIGLSLGLAGALTAARSMRGLLFGIEPWDPLSQTATIVVLGLAAIAAAWKPTHRAMRVDPATVLRAE
jgi:putative ABC transport system permease protein